MSETRSLLERYNDGEIFPFQAIYDVDINPIFEIKDYFGYIGDSVKNYYEKIEFINDKSKNKVETIVLKKSLMSTYISHAGFRIVETLEEGAIDFSKWKEEIERGNLLFKHLVDKKIRKIKAKKTGFAPIKSYKNQKLDKVVEVPAERVEPLRIGIRFYFILKRDQEHIKQLNKRFFFSENIIQKYCRDYDKIHNFELYLCPNPSERNGKSEKILKFSVLPGVIINDGLAEKRVELQDAVMIDFIEGYFPPLSIKSELMISSYENICSSILPLFMKEVK